MPIIFCLILSYSTSEECQSGGNEKIVDKKDLLQSLVLIIKLICYFATVILSPRTNVIVSLFPMGNYAAISVWKNSKNILNTIEGSMLQDFTRLYHVHITLCFVIVQPAPFMDLLHPCL
jgi:nitrate reductase gamma subunit